MLLRFTAGDWPRDVLFELWEESGSPRVVGASDQVWGTLHKPDNTTRQAQCSVVSSGVAGSSPAQVSFPFVAADFTSSGDYVLELEHRLTPVGSGRIERTIEPILIYIRPLYGKGRR